MKIKSLKLKNFGRFTDFECEFAGSVTRLVGVNGSGKTSVGLTGIWAALKGIAERGNGVIGERFRFIGPNRKSADIELTLLDEAKNVEVKVTNHITAASNEIVFHPPAGYLVNQEWLNGLLSVAFMSAKNFCAMSSKDQAVLLGIDVSDIDAEIQKIKQEFTLLNRELKTIGPVVEVAPVEKANISDLMHQKEDIDRFNVEQNDRAAEITRHEKYIADKTEEHFRILQQAAAVEDQIGKANDALEGLPRPEPLKSTTEIIDAIHGTEETNRKAEAYRQYIDKKARAEAKADEIKKNRDQLETVAQNRIDRIAEHKFGFDGLSVDESGGLLLNGRPIKEPYFSKGEQELIVARLHASINPDLKVRFIDDFEALDDDNQAKIVDELLAAGFQVICAEVGKKSDKENVVLLRECQKVESYDDKVVLL